MSKIAKNGLIITSTIYDSRGADILNNSSQFDTPYIVSGTGTDMYIDTSAYGRVTPGKIYYYIGQCSGGWSPGHGSGVGHGKGTLWLYMCKTYNPEYYGYDTPVCFTSSNWVREGVWKYTVPTDYNMARVRINTYSNDGSTVSVGFSNIHLIPEEYYTDEVISAVKIADSYISANDIMEY